jgi:hypothetical protein
MGTTQAGPVQPISAFYLFEEFTRDQFTAANGGQPPADWNPMLVFDPASGPAPQEKLWFDPAQVGKTGTVTYNVVRIAKGSAQPTALATVEQLTMTCAQAAAVNIPGLIQYPPYVVTPNTEARYGGALVTSNVFSEQGDGAAILAALQAINPGVTLIDATYVTEGVVAWTGFSAVPGIGPGETRRMWAILIPGNTQPFYVGELMIEQNAMGVGYPGVTWNIVGNAPVVTLAPRGPDGVNNATPASEVAVPIGALPAGFQFVSGAVPGSVEISTAAPVSSGGGMTAQQAQQIAQAAADTAAIRAKLGQMFGTF